MKKLIALILAAAMTLSLAACGKTTVELDKSDLTFTAAGETQQLTAESKKELTWSSSDETVATVDQSGLVTAVAPGTATITVSAGDVSATCTVKCDWEVVIDLASFYEEMYAELYPMDADGNPTGPFCDDLGLYPEILPDYFPGLTDISTEQLHIYLPMMSAVAFEIVLIQVSDAADVEAVKAILQARIDSQINGGGWYPAVIEGWQNDSRIVSNGSYVMLAVGEDCDTFVDAFNAQF